MAPKKSAKADHVSASKSIQGSEGDFPFSESVGYQIRSTHRALQRLLQQKIEAREITLGMWYFLRSLWNEDGLTQRELSKRVGTMEPTTLSAIVSMEKRGLVRRVRNKSDRRKIHIYLTAKGHALKKDLLPVAREVVAIAVNDLSQDDVKHLLRSLAQVQKTIRLWVSEHEARSSGAIIE